LNEEELHSEIVNKVKNYSTYSKDNFDMFQEEKYKYFVPLEYVFSRLINNKNENGKTIAGQQWSPFKSDFARTMKSPNDTTYDYQSSLNNNKNLMGDSDVSHSKTDKQKNQEEVKIEQNSSSN